MVSVWQDRCCTTAVSELRIPVRDATDGWLGGSVFTCRIRQIVLRQSPVASNSRVKFHGYVHTCDYTRFVLLDVNTSV